MSYTPSSETVDEILSFADPNCWESDKQAAKASLRQAIEGMVERVIAPDEITYADYDSWHGEAKKQARDELRDEQRQRAKEELSKMFPGERDA